MFKPVWDLWKRNFTKCKNTVTELWVYRVCQLILCHNNILIIKMNGKASNTKLWYIRILIPYWRPAGLARNQVQGACCSSQTVHKQFQQSWEEALRVYCPIKYTCEPCPIFSYGCSQAVRAINPKRGHLAMPFCNFISHWCTRLNAGEILAGGKGEPIVWNRSIFFV